MPVGFRYSRWDGTQAGFELEADDILSEITDDLLYHGDLNAALRRMMQSGFRDQNGERLAGMRELMERLRRRRKDELEKYDLGGVYDDIARELREVVEQERQGMEQLGDFFPGNPQNLDELLEQMAEQMAAMQAMLNSMTPEQRAQLQGLAEQLLEDMDLRWQVDQLGEHLRGLFPQMGWDRKYNFSGQDPLGFAEAAQLMDKLGDIDQLENLMRSAASPGALAEVDIDKARDLLGDDGARSLERLAELAKMLEEAGLIEQKEGRYELTPKGMRKIGQNALADLFAKLNQDRFG